MNIRRTDKKLKKLYGGAVSAERSGGSVRLFGRLERWDDVVAACFLASRPYSRTHVINDIVCPQRPVGMRLPTVSDSSLEGLRPDVLIIGGGISGCSIARELSKWKLDILLIDKEADLAKQTSSRNDGEIHCGLDLGKGSVKQSYVTTGNRLTEQICAELGVPFEHRGQLVGVPQRWLYPAAKLLAWQRRSVCGIKDTRILNKKEMLEIEPNINPDFSFALYNPSAACVSPYGLTIALAQNAVRNGARVSLDTVALSMDVKDRQILSVRTNRGTVYPKLVINAAGIFAEDVAAMACDRFFSLHYRRGTNSILDSKTGRYINGVAAIKDISGSSKYTKGGGVIRTAHDNLLIGPDAVETSAREDFSTDPASIKNVFAKQRRTFPRLSERDIITYFTGIRACTFEEDYIIEKGRAVDNLIHCAGIQSPGLTTAVAVAADVAKTAAKLIPDAQRNEQFDPHGYPIPELRKLPKQERDALIKQNPDYGVIVCRCEEISKGEILDALRSPLCPPTVDAIKKRLRPGMGRCQGGFCLPLVMKIISEYTGKPLEEIKKDSEGAFYTFGAAKDGEKDEL